MKLLEKGILPYFSASNDGLLSVFASWIEEPNILLKRALSDFSPGLCHADCLGP